jgi:hypothetical protein
VAGVVSTAIRRANIFSREQKNYQSRGTAMSDSKYGPETRALREATGADLVITIVIGGAKGHGMASASSRVPDPRAVATMLRQLAQQVDMAAASGEPFDVTITPANGGLH